MPRRRRKREGPEFEDIAVWVSGRAGQCCLCQRPTDEGELIRPEGEGKARCLRCAGLEGLMYVHPGDPALTRRARRFSTRQAVILQSWSGRVLRHFASQSVNSGAKQSLFQIASACVAGLVMTLCYFYVYTFS